MTRANNKVTIYSRGVAGNIVRREAHLLRIVDRGANGADVVFRIPRGRAERTISSFESSFWLVANGWGHPKPDSLFHRAEETPSGATVLYGRYRSCDPSWITDFLAGVGASLTVRAKYHNRVLLLADTGDAAVLRMLGHAPPASEEQ